MARSEPSFRRPVGRRFPLAAIVVAALAVVAAACGSSGQAATGGGSASKPAAQQPSGQQPASGGTNLRQLSGTVKIDGSSTVFPVSEGMAEEFQKATGNVRVTVGISGTGGGFQKFCNGETDISDASRAISAREMEQCKTNNIQFVEVPVAFDGLSVVVSPRNDF